MQLSGFTVHMVEFVKQFTAYDPYAWRLAQIEG